MRNTNETPGEKIKRLFVNIFPFVVAAVVTAFLWFIPQTCDIDAQYAWCWTHPASLLDYIGTILFWIGCGILSGVWLYWIEDEYDEKYGFMGYAGWGCAIVGMLLIMLL